MAKLSHSPVDNSFSRDLIKKNEGKLTYIQIFGFVLITLGIIYFASFLLPSGTKNIIPGLELEDNPTATCVSIAFFTTMLGLAFAFPDMLKGQSKEISTMRIIVFMFTNVICMLLLKIGWDKQSLNEIGLDGPWMGVIAFIFGAKATQSYFENAKSIFSNPTQKGNTELSQIEISRLAVIQNRDELLAKHPNIQSVSDTLKNGNSCVTIYVKNNQIDTIPKSLNARLKNGEVVNVPTEIIPDTGIAKPHIGQATDQLSDTISSNYYGSICCLVESITDKDFIGVVTAGHVFTKGKYFNYGGAVGPNDKRDILINDNPKAKLYYQRMETNQDIAIVELIDQSNLYHNYISFKSGFYKVTDSDYNSSSHNVTIVSRNNNKRDAFILDYNVSFDIQYDSILRYVRNIILIGSTNDRTTSQTVSIGGDSGSCVYHKTSGKLIGLLLGGNNNSSFVLPIEDTLNALKFKTL